MPQLVSIQKASELATKLQNREITISNISYLIQYGKIKKYGENGSTLIDVNDLRDYYLSFKGIRELAWKQQLGTDLNWSLSFDHLREKDTTKHVHRLHPYKGKFIPQLVEYFLDTHTDEFKKESYFKKGDIVLDPFMGSGTTNVQANELGIHSIGIDISRFNCLLAEIKLLDYDLEKLEKNVREIIKDIFSYEQNNKIEEFEGELNREIAAFNLKYFPSPQFKYKLNKRQITKNYLIEKEKEFLEIYKRLIKKYGIELNHSSSNTFLGKWYMSNVRKEINYAFEKIKDIKDKKNKKILAVILSRTIRSCRATTHSDLATLKTPQLNTYYCHKHMKICKPIFSIKSMFNRYALDTLWRLDTFSKIKTNAHCAIFSNDSRTINIEDNLKRTNKNFHSLFLKQKIQGIFTSPPYVGQIDYHEQHAYAYDLFGFTRKDKLEIGPLYKGQGLEARKSYVEGISKVLLNCKKYLAKDYDVFLVANDKYNLYSEIALKSGMKIINMYKRPVLNRTERDKSPYSETIFHLKNKNGAF